jgi:hypothetical protein
MFADLTTLANVNESFYQFFLRTHFAFLSFAHLALADAAIRARPAAEMRRLGARLEGAFEVFLSLCRRVL